MSGGVRRALVRLACGALALLLPAHLRPWGDAVRREAAAIEGDGAALRFALGSLAGLAPRALRFHLLRPLVLLAGDGSARTEGWQAMGFDEQAARHPRTIGIGCAIAATALGIAYLAAAGAPLQYPAINAAALAIGLVLVALSGHLAAPFRRWQGAGAMLAALAIAATAVAGTSAEGATRWVKLGPLFVQPSLILLPALILGFARSRSRLAAAAVMLAAAALALQPDRGMAGALFAGMAAIALVRPGAVAAAALAAAAAGFAATLALPEVQPASLYVDRILYTAFDVHPLAGLAVTGGSALLLLPALTGWRFQRENRAEHAAFGALWLAVIAAAALGNYPTPLVGYGGSAILGYLLAVAALPRASETAAADSDAVPAPEPAGDALLRAGAA